MVSIPSVSANLVNSIKNPKKVLNSAKVINFVTSPQAATISVATLITTNKVVRVISALKDKEEDPAARKYTAATDFLHEAFCLLTLFAIKPLFVLAGLLAGKKAMAKDSFAALNGKHGFDAIGKLVEPKSLDIKVAAKKAKNEAKAAKDGFSQKLKKGYDSFFQFFHKKTGMVDKDGTTARTAINKMDYYNKAISDNTNIAMEVIEKNKKGESLHKDFKGLENLKELYIKTDNVKNKSGSLYKIEENGLNDKDFVDNMLGTANDEENGAKFIKDSIEKGFIKEIKKPDDIKKINDLDNKKEAFITPARKLWGGTAENQTMVNGAKGLGEALGMTAAIAVISPWFTTKAVPPFLKAIGVEHPDEVGKKQVNRIMTRYPLAVSSLKNDVETKFHVPKNYWG